MPLTKIFQDAIKYISEAVSRIFGPNRDTYPETGVQPFEGDANKEPDVKD